MAEKSDPAVFWLADRAKRVAGITGLIGIQTAARKLFLEFGIAVLRRTAGARPERLAFKTLEQLFKLGLARLRQHQATLGGFAVWNYVKLAKFANAVDMAEEINDEELIGGESGKDGSPNRRCVFAADRFAVFRF